MKIFAEAYKEWETEEYATEAAERKAGYTKCSADPMYIRGPGVPTPENMQPL
jgi:hypothetical protein